MLKIRRHNWRHAMLTVALVGAIGACRDVSEEHEELPTTMRLTIGTQVVNVTATSVGGGPIALTVGQQATVTATFLDAAGQPLDHVTDDEFRLDVTDLTPSTITFTRTSAFAGNLLATEATTAGSGKFSLFHVGEGHADFGPFTVSITASASP